MAVASARERSDAADGRATLRTWLRLLTCVNLIENRIRGRLREQFASTLPRFDVLAQLDAAAKELTRGLSLSELCQRLMVSNGNLTGLVETLASEGLVHRSVASHDRRSQIVRLTSAGKRAFDRMVPEHRAWVEEMFAGLSQEDRAQLYELIGKLKNSAQAVLDKRVR